METSEQAKMERCLAILDHQLDQEITRGCKDTARYLYGQIVGALALARTLEIIDELEEDRQFQAVQSKFYDAF